MGYLYDRFIHNKVINVPIAFWARFPILRWNHFAQSNVVSAHNLELSNATGKILKFI